MIDEDENRDKGHDLCNLAPTDLATNRFLFLPGASGMHWITPNILFVVPIVLFITVGRVRERARSSNDQRGTSWYAMAICLGLIAGLSIIHFHIDLGSYFRDDPAAVTQEYENRGDVQIGLALAAIGTFAAGFELYRRRLLGRDRLVNAAGVCVLWLAAITFLQVLSVRLPHGLFTRPVMGSLSGFDTLETIGILAASILAVAKLRSLSSSQRQRRRSRSGRSPASSPVAG